MKTDFKFISTLLIVMLTVLLVAIFISYFNEPFVINTDVLDNKLPIANHDDNIDDIGENEKDLISGESFIKSAEVSSESVSGENNHDDFHIIDPQNDDKTVIITSDDTMTNKEKRQILSELDTALMELLEAVDKVQTVDETRLVNKEESEVQK